MSEDLQALRAQIDAIDRDMVRLFETRMGVSEQVAAYKLERGLPVLDAAREEQVLDARAALAQADNGEDVRALYREILHLSKAAQRRLLPVPEK